jgi:hypothetical protein
MSFISKYLQIFPVLIFGLITFQDIIFFYGLENYFYLLFFIFFIFCLANFLLLKKHLNLFKRIPKIILIFMIAAILLGNLYSYFFLGKLNTSHFLLSFWLGILLASFGGRSLLIFIILIPVINFFLQLLEYKTDFLIFPTVVENLDLVVGSKEWMISDNSLRTKGLFEGPLHIVSVSLISILIRPRLLLLKYLMLINSFLGAARLGLIISVLVIFKDLILRFSLRKFFILLIAVLLVILIVYTEFDLGRTQFIQGAMNFSSNESNMNRLSVWLYSIQFFLNFDFFSMLFGRFGEIKTIFEHGSTESDWLRLLVDCGLLGFVAYLLSFMHLWAVLKKSFPSRGFIFLIITGAMILYPCLGFMASATAFWTVYFSILNKNAFLAEDR